MKTSTFIYFLLLFFIAKTAQSQEVVVPVDIHLPLLFKAINFEKNIEKSDDTAYTVVIIYDGANNNSEDIRREIQSFIQGKNSIIIGNKIVHFISIDVQHKKNIESTLHSVKPQAVYVAPLVSLPIHEITQTSQKEKILSMTGVPEYVDDGISLGIGIKGNSPEIIINLASCREEGIEFSSKVLGIARVIQ